jgi:hypothetical protein
MTEPQPSLGITQYKHSRGHRGVLSVTFFLIVLFMVNALAGAVWLATHNLHTDSVVFVLMFATGAVLLLYAGLFLFAAAHSEVTLGPDKATLVLPNWRGPSPLFPYTETEVRYSDITAVETRSEVYRYFVLPVSVRSACLVSKDGRRLTLGYVRSNSLDPAMPFPTIAEDFARRAGVPVLDRGIVEAGRGLRALVQDEPGWDAPAIAAERAEFLHRRESLGWKIVMGAGAVALLLAVGFQVSRFFGA